MKQVRWSVLVLVVALLCVSVAPVAAEPPPLPSSFWGYVNAPAGGTVTAWINGVQYAATTLMDYAGRVVYSLNVNGDLYSTPDVIEGGRAGDVVAFQVNGTWVAQTGVWISGTNQQLDLTVAAVEPTPTPTTSPTATPIPQPTATPRPLPPPLPASFWGYVSGKGLVIGDAINVKINGVKYASTTVRDVGGGLKGYALNVPGDQYGTVKVEGGTEGAVVEFWSGGKQLAPTAIWHSGTNVRVDLAPMTTVKMRQ